MSSAAVVDGALRVKVIGNQLFHFKCYLAPTLNEVNSDKKEFAPLGENYFLNKWNPS